MTCDAEGNYIQFEETDFEQKNSNTNFVEPTSTVSAADNGIAPKNSIRNPEPVVNNESPEILSDREITPISRCHWGRFSSVIGDGSHRQHQCHLTYLRRIMYAR